jgi:hypothetical protein
MTKLYIFVQKLIKLKRKLSARLGYKQTKPIQQKSEANRTRAMLQMRSNEKLLFRLQRKYRNRALAPRQYEKWI